MKTRQIEILVGLFMAAGMVALFFLAMKVSNLGSISDSEGYPVKAYFDNIGGLKVKAPVTMAGVEVGRVVGIGYDQALYQAEVQMSIYNRFDRIPDDTIAKILTAGLLGEQYLGLDPGGSEKMLKAGMEIKLTQSALVLEDVIGQFIYGKAQEGMK